MEDPSSPKGTGKEGSAWSRFHAQINDVADSFFYRLGYWVAGHAKRTLAISILFVIACCCGFANFEIETAGENLWVPADSISKEQEAIINTFFDDSAEYAVLLIESPSEGGSVVTKESLDALWELDALVLGLETPDGNTFEDLCATELDGVTCLQPFRGILRFWGNSFETYQATVSTDADVLAAINVEFFPDGQAVSLESIFGNSITYDADTGDLSAARAALQTYSLTDEDETDEWYTVFQDTLEVEVDNITTFNVLYFTGRSIDDALEESVSGEIILFIATYVIMVVFVQIAIGRCCAGSVGRRTWLGPGGVLLVLSAGIAAYGLNSGFGIPFTSLAQILPFILIGIGVDDMFVIVASYDHTDPSLPVEERVALAVKRCGVSVTYTSLTNFFAFMLGSTTSLPAVEYFCLYAGTAILFDYFLQMTAFVALLTMDANRQKAGRLDWCCCFTSKRYLREQETIQRGVTLDAANNGTGNGHNGNGGGVVAGGTAEVHQLGAVGKFMKDKYTPFLLSTTGKALVLLGSAALLTAGIYGVTQATQGFDVLDLAPDDHFARDYTELSRDYDLEIDSQFLELAIYTRRVDYPDVSVQAEIQASDALMLEQPFVVGPVDSWLVSFVQWADNTTDYAANVGTSGGYPVYNDRATFYEALGEFTQDGNNARFLSDIVFTENGEIEISRTQSFLVGLTDSEKNVDALMDARDVTDQSPLEPQPFAFSAVFIFVEQFVVIYEELMLNFLLALVAVAVLSLFVLGKVSVVVLVCLTVVMIDAELLGFVYHWGLEVNSITVIQLIMAVGLVVDYMVHIVHYFLHQDPGIPKDARIAEALGEIGPSVMVGAATTFLGIVPLAFASNLIYRVFFRMFLIIITFGAFHGVCFMPVALSLLPDSLVSSSSPHAPSGSNGVKSNKEAAGHATVAQG